MIMVVYFLGFSHELFFFLLFKVLTELKKMTNTMVGKFVDEE